MLPVVGTGGSTPPPQVASPDMLKVAGNEMGKDVVLAVK
jgi:hypothetical protein